MFVLNIYDIQLKSTKLLTSKHSRQMTMLSFIPPKILSIGVSLTLEAARKKPDI